jgi:hypothetical protein
LKLLETAAFIAYRIRTAGGDPAKLFTREAVMLIHDLARGIPRTISVVCDNALLSGFAAGQQPVGRDLVTEVADDFDITAPRESTTIADPLPEHPSVNSPLLLSTPVTPEEALQAGSTEHGNLEMARAAGSQRRFSLFGS